MKDCLGTHFLQDGVLIRFSPATPDPAGRPGDVYEVFRVMDGVPLFLEDHLDRLCHSLHLTGEALPCPEKDMAQAIFRLVREGGIRNGNIRLVCHPGPGTLRWTACQVAHEYPAPELYRAGIPVVLFQGTRLNPNAKQVNPGLARMTSKVRQQEQVHETLLVDPRGCITEGSRSNVFFIREDSVLTPPVADVLPGITRKHVMGCCRDKGIPVHERRIAAGELPLMEAAFLSSTSRRVLPINRIGDLPLPSDHPLIREIQHAFNNRVTTYLLSAKMKDLH